MPASDRCFHEAGDCPGRDAGLRDRLLAVLPGAAFLAAAFRAPCSFDAGFAAEGFRGAAFFVAAFFLPDLLLTAFAAPAEGFLRPLRTADLRVEDRGLEPPSVFVDFFFRRLLATLMEWR